MGLQVLLRQGEKNVHYMEKSWIGLDEINKVFQKAFKSTWTAMLFPGWDGENYGGPDLSDGKERKRLSQNRDKLLRFYCRRPNHPYTREVLNLATFIDLALTMGGAQIRFC